MLRKATGFLIASLFVSSAFAAVLDGDDFVSATSVGGRANDWSLTFFSIASQANMKPGKTETSTRSLDTYDYFSLNYKVSGEERASLRLPFLYNTAGQDEYGEQQTSNFAMQDIHFVYQNYDLGYFGDIDLSGKVKVYLPSSKVSQEQGLITKIRLEGYADYRLSRRWSLAYVAKPDIYWQSQTASLNSSIPTFDDGMYVTDPRQTNKQFGLEHYLQVQWEINQMFAFSTKTGFVENWYHSSATEGLEGDHTTALRLGLNMWIKPVRGLSFSLGIGNDSMLGSYKGEDTKIWQPFNTQYSLMTNIYVL
ncbi:hypothetical protein B9G69_011595 [Bdellovibrio sp. SKB1291214]|uniref:hypothetical protein n=1 Tax=Bdellovibrio sp. SKB1291214 TaxID=1732569 RepID=UPI000B51A861|nr:hypothetical protein [Bdellovibrio sp. SKB1291214]UYL07690.1 hypothetical protein B9G69_011595 [Bdellovibrio sp. SKB1291214]